MKLVLSVFSNLGVEISNITLKQEPTTLGRNTDNTVVLEDPDLYISGRHAVIDYQAPDYFITDVSTNGVFINELPSPIGKGKCTKLNDGDQLHIGKYLLVVKIVAEQQSSDLTTGPITGESFENDPFVQLHKDREKERIKKNKLMPEQGKVLETFDSSNLDRSESALNEELKENSSEINQPPAYKEAVQPLKDESKDHKPSKLNTFFEEDFKESQESSGASAQEFSSEREESIDLPDDLDSPNEYADNLANRFENLVSKGEPYSASDQELKIIENFVCGAGLENTKINELLTPESFYIIGKILRTSIQGTIDVLVGRNKIKNEMHLDVTTFRSGANNPIKFSVSAEGAINKLLSTKEEGYLSAEEAIEEAYDDILAHQFSVIAGMQTALLGVLTRFDPDKLERRLQEHNPISARIPVHKQAKLWSLFEQLYDDIEREATDNFYRLFGEVFAESYEQQIINLKKSKKVSPF